MRPSIVSFLSVDNTKPSIKRASSAYLVGKEEVHVCSLDHKTHFSGTNQSKFSNCIIRFKNTCGGALDFDDAMRKTFLRGYKQRIGNYCKVKLERLNKTGRHCLVTEKLILFANTRSQIFELKTRQA